MRQLRTMIVGLDLAPETARIRTGIDDVTRSPTRDALSWDIAAPGSRTPVPGGWSACGDVWPARVRLPGVPGDYVSDDEWAESSADPRVVVLPALRGEGIRRWDAIDLAYDEPEGTEVTFRVNDGTADRYWNGSALSWVLATNPALHWSTASAVIGHIESFPVAGRALQVKARLSSSEGKETPAFYGAHIAYSVRDQGDEDDALVRTLLRTLRDEVTATAPIEGRARAGGQSAFTLPGEITYPNPTAVECAFDITADPNELAPLAGAYNAGTKTWTASAPIPAGHRVRFELRYQPALTVSLHRDAMLVDEVPAVWITPIDAPEMIRAQDDQWVRDPTGSVPTGLAVPAPALVEVQLQVRIIAELASDVRRIMTVLRNWFRAGGNRPLVSPETGRIVDIREVQAFRTSPDMLTQGVAEARAIWAIQFYVSGNDSAHEVSFVRSGGLFLRTEGS